MVISNTRSLNFEIFLSKHERLRKKEKKEIKVKIKLLTSHGPISKFPSTKI